MIEERQNGCLKCFADKLSMRIQATNRRIQHPSCLQQYADAQCTLMAMRYVFQVL